MKKKLFILLIGLLCLSACTSQEPTLQRFQRVIGGSDVDPVGFDTSFTLIGYTETEKQFNDYIDQLREEMMALNQLFDKYNNYEGVNNLKTINDKAGIEPVVVDSKIIELLLMSKEQYDENYQKFDPTLGALLDIWHDYREEGLLLNEQDQYGEIPSRDILEEAKACTGWDFVEINQEDSSVFLTKDCASLDLGGIAKGYATELVSKSLYDSGLEHFSLSSGGNVKVQNTKPDGSQWNIGIGEPVYISLGTTVDVLSIDEELSIVTSGDYQRFYYGADMQLLHHLIDPETLMPLNQFRSTTIVMKDSGYADMYSTVLYLLDYETGKEWIEAHNKKYPDQQIEGYWVIDSDSEYWNHPDFMQAESYKVAMSDGLRSRSKLLNP